MNRCEFVGQTHQGAMITVDDVMGFFDHTMAVYDIVKNIEAAHINTIQDIVHSSLKVQVESSNIPELEGVVDHVNNIIHNRADVYGRHFKLEAGIHGNIVELSIHEELA